MKKFEYKDSYTPSIIREYGSLMDYFIKMGDHGWELVAIHGDDVYFKRELHNNMF